MPKHTKKNQLLLAKGIISGIDFDKLPFLMNDEEVKLKL